MSRRSRRTRRQARAAKRRPRPTRFVEVRRHGPFHKRALAAVEDAFWREVARTFEPASPEQEAVVRRETP